MSGRDVIALSNGDTAAILYEDRSVLAIDKPRRWMLAPSSWTHTSRNLQTEITGAIAARDFWAKSRNLKFLRYVHRLDADTTGVLLMVKSRGALSAYTTLFESRRMHKTYLAVVRGVPGQAEWTCRLKLSAHPDGSGRVRADAARGREAETYFKVLDTRPESALLEAMPLTGRTHQIRVHLAESGLPVIGDALYGRHEQANLALRAVSLSYIDPFNHRRVVIRAPVGDFLGEYGYQPNRKATRPHDV